MMKRSEYVAKELQLQRERWLASGFAFSGADVAGLIAKMTGCDKGCAEAEVDLACLLEVYHLPLRMSAGKLNVAIVSKNDHIVASGLTDNPVRRDSALGHLFAHMVACVNRDAELAEVGEWVESSGLPWELLHRDEGSRVCVVDRNNTCIARWVSVSLAVAGAYEYLVNHMNSLPWRDGCPKTEDAG